MINSRWPRPIGTMPSMALMPGLQRLADRLAVDDAGRDALDRPNLRGVDRPLAVDRLAERVDDATEQLVADRHRDDAAGAADLVAFANQLVVAEEHRADRVLLEVQRDAEHAVRELDHLARHGALDALKAGDAVADGHHRADLGHVHVGLEAANLLADDAGDVVCFDRSWVSVRVGRGGTSRLSRAGPTAPSCGPVGGRGCRRTRHCRRARRRRRSPTGSTRADSVTCWPVACESASRNAPAAPRSSGTAVVTSPSTRRSCRCTSVLSSLTMPARPSVWCRSASISSVCRAAGAMPSGR